MKIKLIQTKDYLLLIDEESRGIEFGEIGVNMRHSKLEVETRNMGGYGSDKYYWSHKKLIAYYPLTKEAKELDLPLLPNPFEKEIDETTLFKNLGYECFIKMKELNPSGGIKEFIRIAVEFGYKAAQSSNKQFSLEDIKKAIEMAREMKDNESIFDVHSIRGLTEVCTYDWEERYSEKEIIQSLSTQQLPKEFIPEYRYYYHSSKEFYSDAGFVECSKEQYESIKVEIPTCPLKVEIKTITNSEGKEVLVGTYIN